MQRQPLEFVELISCWQKMPRNAGEAPRKTTFSPKNLGRIMPFLFLIERQADDALTIRLKGSELDVNTGRAASGETVFDTLIHRDWNFYKRFLRRCADAICGGHLELSIAMRGGLINNVEVLHVPLADKNGSARYMLGVMISRPERRDEGDSSQKSRTPVLPILKYQYLDLGCGIPEEVTVLKPALMAARSGTGAKRIAASGGTACHLI